MISDPIIQEQGYFYFLREAPELLEAIEQELLTLPEKYTKAKVNNLMRAAHTLKGSAANVGLEAIQTVAHSFEDVVRVLYNPNVIIDTELQTLLLEAYECLRLPLMARIQPGGSINENEIIDRANEVFARIKAQLKDYWDEEVEIPTSIDLGFDIVESMFSIGVQQQLEEIAAALASKDADKVRNLLLSETEVFVVLAESLNLPGFRAIAKNTIAALNAHPEQVLNIATIALEDFQQAREQVLAGDRTLGGTPSLALQQLAGVPVEEQLSPQLSVQGKEDILNPPQENILYSEEQFEEFLTSDRYNTKKPLQPKECRFYLRATRYCLEWFRRLENIPPENLSLTLLVPKVPQEEQQVKAAAKYVDSWLGRFLDSENNPGARQSLCLYRQGAMLKVIVAIAQFLYNDQINSPQETRDIPLIKILQHQLSKVVKEYKQHPPITDAEKKWQELSSPQKLIPSQHHALPPEIAPPEIAPPEMAPPEMAPPFLRGAGGGSPRGVKQTAPESTEIQPRTPEAVVPLAQEKQTPPYPSLRSQAGAWEREENEREEAPLLKGGLGGSSEASPSWGGGKIPNQTVRVDLQELERLNYLTGNLLTNQNRQIAQDEQLQQAVQELRERLLRHQQTLNRLRDWSNLIFILPEIQYAPQSGDTSDTSKVPGIRALPKKTPKSKGNFRQPGFDALELDEYTELASLFHSALEETAQLEVATDGIDHIAKQLSYTLEKQQRLVSHVRNDMTAVQMLPFGDILERFPPMIQQLARSKNKPVELKISGNQVLVDKAIAEKLYEPLLHLVRNAFDHGIESPDIRRQHKKPPAGEIEIRAHHQSNYTIISVRDDGKGLDFDSIRLRAVEMKLVSPEQVDRLSTSQLLDFLFEPGFSTKKTVSDLSGRGIGLDIVHNQLQALRGTITVESQPQMGTTFSLKIPFSLTSAKLFVCQAGGATYALLSDTIAKIVLPKPEQIRVFEGKKVLMYGQGQSDANKTGTDTSTSAGVIPVLKLSELIKYTSGFASSTFARNFATPIKAEKPLSTQLLLLEGNTAVLALEVDQIVGEQELVIRPLGTAIAAPSYVFGCSILGDGRLILAIDGAILLEQAFSPPPSLPLSLSPPLPLPLSPSPSPSPSLPLSPSSSPSSSFTPKTVLVVDDSLSYRQTLAMNLQKAGYKVLQAQDGIEALEQLRQSPEIGLILCDIEMPNMNGFEFLNHLRQDSALPKIPVVMLTSRISEKHRLLALSLGAAAYLTKPYLEKELLTTIAQLHPSPTS